MASYSLAAIALLAAVANAFGAQRPRPGILLQHGYPILEVINLVILAPVIESLILIAMIELLRRLGLPGWLQLGLPASISAALHIPVSHALVVAPTWFIMGGAYLLWRRASWKVGFAVIAPIHALINLPAAISIVGYVIHRHNA